MSTPTILCVDDERNVLLTLRAQLSRHFPGYRIEIAESGDEALELVDALRSEGVDIPLVLADQIMPGMRGDDLLIALHTRYPQILKVMLTGQARVEDVGNVVNRGSLYRFIAKPWNEVDLQLTVTEALRSYQQEQQLVQQHLMLEQVNRELAALNAELQHSNAALLQATRLKDEFLATVSHELRTPLTAILGLSEGLQEGILGTTSECQKTAIATIERNGQKLLALINDILEVSTIEAGRLELTITNVSVVDLCHSCLAFVNRHALKKHIQLTTTFAPDLGDIAIDERRMRQVLINLLMNAIKFTPDGGRVTLEVSVQKAEGRHLHAACKASPGSRQEVQVQPESVAPVSRLLFSVTDTGIGIAPADHAKLFHPFIQLDSGLNRKYEGSGLGLTLVKQIVELHGGAIGLTSQLGRGSCFTVQLPVSPSVLLTAVDRQDTIATLLPQPVKPA